MALWTPTQTTTDLWLDASDASTITLNGSTVSEWRDKSGNTLHATQATATNQPALVSASQNGLDVISLDGSDNYLTTVSITLGTATSLFVVYKPDTLSGDRTILNRQYGSGNLPWNHYISSTGRWNDWLSGGYASGVTAGQYFILSEIQSATNLVKFWGNGTAGTDGTSNTGFPSSGAISIGQAQSYGALGWADGSIAEIILIKSALSDADRQMIEGYLAWKWGLEANLPTGHTYEFGPPSDGTEAIGSVVMPPMLISGKVWNIALGNVVSHKMLITGEAENPIAAAGSVKLLPKISGTAHNPIDSAGSVAMRCPQILGRAVNNEIAAGGVSALGKVWGKVDNPKATEVIRYRRCVQ